MTIAIILDRNFGIKLMNLPLKEAVWICESPSNTRSVEELSKSKQDSSLPAITTFAYEDEDEAADTLMDILYDVTLNHKWETIDVFGFAFDQNLKAEIDFTLKIVFDKVIKTAVKTFPGGFKIEKVQ